MGTGAELVHEQIRKAFEAVHHGQRDGEQRQADVELLKAIHTNSEIEIEIADDISLEALIANEVQFTEWAEEVETVEVEVVDLDCEFDSTRVLVDCVCKLEQTPSQSFECAYDIGEIRESSEELIELACRNQPTGDDSLQPLWRTQSAHYLGAP